MNDMQRVLESARKSVKDAKDHLRWAEKELTRAEKQSRCKHENVDEMGVFGDTCKDCDWFFNNGF